jgi:hypothetical protein
MISGYAAFASEDSKAGRSRSAISPAADINCFVPHLDALQDRINGFIHKHRFLRELNRIGGASANNRRTIRRSQ